MTTFNSVGPLRFTVISEELTARHWNAYHDQGTRPSPAARDWSLSTTADTTGRNWSRVGEVMPGMMSGEG